MSKASQITGLLGTPTVRKLVAKFGGVLHGHTATFPSNEAVAKFKSALAYADETARQADADEIRFSAQ